MTGDVRCESSAPEVYQDVRQNVHPTEISSQGCVLSAILGGLVFPNLFDCSLEYSLGLMYGLY
jgi:hypothetical protein